MTSTELAEIMERAEKLPPEEQLSPIAALAERVRCAGVRERVAQGVGHRPATHRGGDEGWKA